MPTMFHIPSLLLEIGSKESGRISSSTDFNVNRRRKRISKDISKYVHIVLSLCGEAT